ncbi:disrupted in renal carcinoma protein 2-like protein [Plakobranchus ocellatus]|uniref:Disrupted in renal carcinoma protein 2-like protein n=1 Tax=Plakobranchus ocellatus TaxID=259542 RepID=A0AAV4CC67_9GAST|nr:disrupted in renal carcinoma protein 2-like protein [Plakobranchus ocellatus]
MMDDMSAGKDRTIRIRRYSNAVAAPGEQSRVPQPPADQKSPGAAAASPVKLPGEQMLEAELTTDVKIPCGTDLPCVHEGETKQAPLKSEADVMEIKPGPRPPAAMVYEGSAALYHQSQPSRLVSLPANTTDDAKLVDQYEHLIGTPNSPHDRSMLEQLPSLNSSQDQNQISRQDLPTSFPARQFNQGHGEAHGIDQESACPDPAPSLAQSTNNTTTTDNLSSLQHISGLHRDDLFVPKEEQGQDSSFGPQGKPAFSNSRTVEVAYAENDLVANSSPQPGTSNAVSPTSIVPQSPPAQSLKDILANVVLEEQVITIKLHRDLPPRRSGLPHQSVSEAKAATATNSLVNRPSVPHSDQSVTHLPGHDKRGRFITHRAHSNIETSRHGTEAPTPNPSGLPFNSPSLSVAGPSGLHRSQVSCTPAMTRSSSDAAFSQDQSLSSAGPTQRERIPSSFESRQPGRSNSAAARAEEERLKRISTAVVYRTGRRSAPVFSRRGFGTTEFWNSGQTSINRINLKHNFARPPVSSIDRRSRPQGRGELGRKRSRSVGEQRRTRRGKTSSSEMTEENDLINGRVSAPAASKSTKNRKGGKKLARYGSMNERSMRHSLDECPDDEYNCYGDEWDEYDDDVMVEQLFAQTARPRSRLGPGSKSGPWSRKKFLRQTSQVDPLSSRWTSDEEAAGTVGRALSAQDVEWNGESWSGRTSSGRRTQDSEVGKDRSDEDSDDSESSSSDETSALLKETKTEIYSRRWYLLFLFSMTALVWNAIWSTWGPVAQSAKQVYHWNDGDIAMFTWLGNLPFLITMFPIAYLMDVKGMRAATVLCCGLMCLGAGLRCIPCDIQTTTWLIRLGQLLNGVAGTVPISGPGLLSGLWFPPNQRATATAISTVMGYLGSCISFVIGPLLVKEPTLSPVNGTSGLLPSIDGFGNTSFSNTTDTDKQKKGIETILYAGES